MVWDCVYIKGNGGWNITWGLSVHQFHTPWAVILNCHLGLYDPLSHSYLHVGQFLLAISNTPWSLCLCMACSTLGCNGFVLTSDFLTLPKAVRDVPFPIGGSVYCRHIITECIKQQFIGSVHRWGLCCIDWHNDVFTDGYWSISKVTYTKYKGNLHKIFYCRLLAIKGLVNGNLPPGKWKESAPSTKPQRSVCYTGR
ncbi:hypothetical protein XENTR_v10014890 [Xenopus tropicalis]|nr:hypothetical protein XENTR_v10014890 [Xenopus tropicalis]KAE8604913.1 hypothetical protein XENTR_v10014890 [Xenopus tropicalis]